MTEIERVRVQLRQLGLRTMADAFEAEADLAAKSQSSFVAYLGRLVDLEAAAKTDRSIRARLARAHFPAFCTLEAFDFSFQPWLNAAAVRELATLGFLQEAVNLVWVGPPNTGKSHLAIAVGIKACEAHKTVLFVKAADLLDQLLAASVNRTLGRLLTTLTRPDLLVIDEVGYLPMSEPTKANLFFQTSAGRTRTCPWRSPPTGPSRNGPRSSATRSSPPPSWTGYCTIASCSRSTAQAIASRTSSTGSRPHGVIARTDRLWSRILLRLVGGVSFQAKKGSILGRNLQLASDQTGGPAISSQIPWGSRCLPEGYGQSKTHSGGLLPAHGTDYLNTLGVDKIRDA